ncbi:sugar ABC transporter ATP-binding protein [Buttiauxella sp. A111]|uniref:sugar ABC transporter ATP-binding protein n=1 Tax=Buttiauxella sp. A111 TaxID=2563088 RepID=UPI0010D98D61|nr:sugar ABC transporter ATP-binding protein [Buttiauxella sp. A111]GDX07615.1 sugar ABC transporter ATP-binding protein [Buttiauxella sp. A111]
MTRLVAVKDVVKKFSGTVALKDVTFDIQAGEVHVLLGENGAGKSTLMKILSGIYAPTSGEIILGDQSWKSLTPVQSRKFGIRLIYQELSVIDHLSIEENLFVGSIPTRRVLGISVVDRALMREKASKAMSRVGLNRPPQTLVSALSISEKQQVEIAKALVEEPRIIIMDEPTSSLNDEEVARLFIIINDLRRSGIGIVYISHKLKEIPVIGDRVSVLKDGCYVGTWDAKTTPIETLVARMVGRELNHARPDGQNIDKNDKVFAVDALSSKDGMVNNVSFELYRGEILGFAGLMGAGRSELMETIFGVRPKSQGSLTLNNKRLNINNPTDAIRAGIAFVTEDRRRTGFFHNFSVAENISILPYIKSSRHALSLERLDYQAENKMGEQYKTALNIRCTSSKQAITQLSGGNQQKAIIAKWLAAKSDLFIFDEPTRGIDIGAKAEIYSILRDLASSGCGIIVVSSELPELLSVCDRIAVYRHGEIVTCLDNQDATEEKIMHAATVC